LRPKFIADGDLSQDIVKGLRLREPTLDFATAREGGTIGLKDPAVLALAAKSGRILVSHDRKTMPTHFARFVQTSVSPGVIIVPQNLPLRASIEELILIWKASDAREWQNALLSLPL
jgi:hypothetical protein